MLHVNANVPLFGDLLPLETKPCVPPPCADLWGEASVALPLPLSAAGPGSLTACAPTDTIPTDSTRVVEFVLALLCETIHKVALARMC